MRCAGGWDAAATRHCNLARCGVTFLFTTARRRDIEEAGDTMARERIQTSGAPAAIGPYSQAIASSTLVFASGQIALDPASGQLVEGDVGAQTRQALHNLSAVLEAAGSSLGQVVKATVFLVPMAHLTAINEAPG